MSVKKGNLIFVVAGCLLIGLGSCKKCLHCINPCAVCIPTKNAAHRKTDTICAENFNTPEEYFKASQGNDSTNCITKAAMETSFSSCDRPPGGAQCK